MSTGGSHGPARSIRCGHQRAVHGDRRRISAGGTSHRAARYPTTAASAPGARRGRTVPCHPTGPPAASRPATGWRGTATAQARGSSVTQRRPQRCPLTARNRTATRHARDEQAAVGNQTTRSRPHHDQSVPVGYRSDSPRRVRSVPLVLSSSRARASRHACGTARGGLAEGGSRTTSAHAEVSARVCHVGGVSRACSARALTFHCWSALTSAGASPAMSQSPASRRPGRRPSARRCAAREPAWIRTHAPQRPGAPASRSARR
ncbi:hypothetical protein IW245_000212 [Longispora fulva]|uniref:Uncharacterized protein n=1 Tax=Longispora fulva TaxID=619741 RepID=A0A8J7GE24_9ACTN|nr:hypothetical protein [Longispora fulva]